MNCSGSLMCRSSLLIFHRWRPICDPNLLANAAKLRNLGPLLNHRPLQMSEPSQARKILDVGCGWNKTPGAIGIDANPKTHADVIHDLGSIPYPFPDNAFDEIVC